MSFTFEQVEALLERQEKRYEQFQMRVLEILTRQMNLTQKRLSENTCTSHADSLIDSINQFHFEYLAGSKSDSWCKKYKDLFKVDPERSFDAVPIIVPQAAVTLPGLNDIKSPCLTEAFLSHVPSAAVPEKLVSLETFAQIIPEVEQSLGDKPAAATELFTKSHSAYPNGRERSIAASPGQKVISRTVFRSSVEPNKPPYSAQRCIKNKKIATVVNARSRHGQVLDFPTHLRSCITTGIKTMHVQCNEVLFLLLHKDPTTFRGGGA
ncbi:hypothetical protein MN116_000137 [Schistosoma mekongi]|uniref:Uncharacterized protein n=1 Tax=Schistosoma mekongi TaxID=38744 RepID=A0AAE1Z7H5_SCHME|nr:hypothetical protein MN116_000137 [Schistosoma mekongi]